LEVVVRANGQESGFVLGGFKSVEVPEFVAVGSSVGSGDTVFVDNSDTGSIWEDLIVSRGVGVEGCVDDRVEWDQIGFVESDVVVDGNVGGVDNRGGNVADITVPFLVSSVSFAGVVTVPSTGGVAGDGSLADIDGGILEDCSVRWSFKPVGIELVAAKSFSPNNLEAASESGGEVEVGSLGGGTDSEAGDVDLVGVGFVGFEEDVDVLTDGCVGHNFWGAVDVGVGRNVDCSKRVTTAD